MTTPDMRRWKPLDFGANGITGSVDAQGRLIALNAYHPQHGYVTLSAAAPFPERSRYDQAAVRAFRAAWVDMEGFGIQFTDRPTPERFTLLENAIPRQQFSFYKGGNAEITTFAVDGGAFQLIRSNSSEIYWGGSLGLQRCAYTQLTEGGPLPPAPTQMHLIWDGLGELRIINPGLPFAASICGLEADGSPWERQSGELVNVRLGMSLHESIGVVAYGLGLTPEEASHNAHALLNSARTNSDSLLAEVLTEWHKRWQDVPDDPLIRRALAYSLIAAVPAGEGVCFLTDHMLLPLAWTRDAYYAARALLSWKSASRETYELVRRHLIWTFEQMERPDGFWGRSYLANGKQKDGAFQLDQQLFPLLELADYALITGDRETYARLRPHIQPIIDGLLAQRHGETMLFPTHETPADDPIPMPYHLSSHILFWHTLHRLDAVEHSIKYTQLANAIRKAVQDAFIAKLDGKLLYAYATDGASRHHFYHDANDIPLALAPIWGFVHAQNDVWRATVDFAFSEANVGGSYAGRLGSVHTRAPWPLGDVQSLLIGRITDDEVRIAVAMNHLREVARLDGALPEAYDANTGQTRSRHWFVWPGAALVCAVSGAFEQ